MGRITTKERPPTPLEAAVLDALSKDVDPWRVCPGRGTRIVSQALSRLQARGLVDSDYFADRRATHGWGLTEAGRSVLGMAPSAGGRS